MLDRMIHCVIERLVKPRQRALVTIPRMLPDAEGDGELHCACGTITIFHYHEVYVICRSCGQTVYA